MITDTGEFKMSAGKFLTEVIFKFAAPWLLTLLALGLIGLSLGIIVDYRWMLGTLFIIFILAPTLMVFIYYYFGLRREAYVNTVLHTISLQDKGMSFTLKFPVSNHAESSDVENEEVAQVRNEFFSYADMLPMKTGLNSVSIPLRSPAKGYLWIPRSAFQSDEDMSEFLEYLDNKIRQSEHIDNQVSTR